MHKKLKVLEPETRKLLSTMLKELEKNIDHLYEIATTDEKTGVYNHKFFNTLAKMEFEKAKRGAHFSLMIIDLDNFKRLNDTYGHLAGDKVLKKLAEILKENVRKYDIVARFGGEEFLVLFPDTNYLRANVIANRLRKKVEVFTFFKKYPVTISGGIASYKKGDTLSRLSRRADKALYKAKKLGRNRIETE